MPYWRWESPLYMRDPEAVAEMLRRDPSSVHDINDGYTVAGFAVVSDFPEALPLLAAAGADLNAGDETPLTLAAQATEGRARSVALLLEFGADPDRPDASGATPLARALNTSPSGPPDALEPLTLLLRAGADPNLPDGDGDAPLDIAYRHGFAPAARLLVAHGARPLSLFAGTPEEVRASRLGFAALLGDTAAVDALLAAGAEVNARDRRNRTALHTAARAGDAAMVAHLLARGADPHAREDAEEVDIDSHALSITHPRAGATPLHLAAEEGHPEVVRLLLRAGADVEAHGGPGAEGTPLTWAVLGASWDRRSPAEALETLRILLDAGADVRAGDADATRPWRAATPLVLAAWLGEPSHVTLLLERGAVRSVAELLPAMRAATEHNGYRNLPTLWAYGRRALDPPLRLLDLLPHVDGVAVRMLLGEFPDVPRPDPPDRAALNEADPETGETPLLWVVRRLRTETLDGWFVRYDADTVSALLNRGADPDARDRAENTAYALAGAAGHEDVVEVLNLAAWTRRRG